MFRDDYQRRAAVRCLLQRQRQFTDLWDKEDVRPNDYILDLVRGLDTGGPTLTAAERSWCAFACWLYTNGPESPRFADFLCWDPGRQRAAGTLLAALAAPDEPSVPGTHLHGMHPVDIWIIGQAVALRTAPPHSAIGVAVRPPG